MAEAAKGMAVEIDREWIEQRKAKLLEELAKLADDDHSANAE